MKIELVICIVAPCGRVPSSWGSVLLQGEMSGGSYWSGRGCSPVSGPEKDTFSPPLSSGSDEILLSLTRLALYLCPLESTAEMH
jgi:hypothetical protein